MGDVLEFGNSKDDRDAVESCLKIFTLLTGSAFIHVRCRITYHHCLVTDRHVFSQSAKEGQSSPEKL